MVQYIGTILYSIKQKGFAGHGLDSAESGNDEASIRREELIKKTLLGVFFWF